MTLDSDHLSDLVERALAEDVGAGDVTSLATVPDGTRAIARIRQKAPGVVFGLDVAELVFRHCDPDARLERTGPEGRWREDGPVLEIEGAARALLAAERTALNFLGHLSGIATLTAICVREVQGTEAKILDTRKTTPGLRLLEKAAVVAGGGHNHRVGLYDEILIKENHIAMAGGVTAAVHAARERFPDLPMEVECETAEQVREALAAGAPRMLLDNMEPAALRAIVEEVDGRAQLECSGGMTRETLRVYAETGIDWISIGALTHSAPTLDLSLLLEPLR
jgi:nicotinate-nucleotide pyrophosphorylase (carboxylating)